MHTFTDNSGRVWTLSVNVAAMKRVRALCGVDLASIVEVDDNDKPSFKLLEQLSSDPILLVDVLYAVCKPEADARNVNDEDFAAAILGNVITAATDALLEDIIDFFPEPKRRMLKQLLTLTRRFEKEITKQAESVFSEENLSAVEDTLIKSFGVAPGSAE